MRLIAADGEQLGIMPIDQALAQAQEQDLDLVEVAPQAEPPVCRLMDYGKWKYEQDVRGREARKRQSHVVVKEMRYRPKISTHDFDFKTKKVEQFLKAGSKVKITIWFRGRELAHPELGSKLLDRISETLSEEAVVEAPGRMDGRNMVMVLAPAKKPGGSAAKPTN